MKCLPTQLHSHEIRPAESDNTIPSCKKTKRHNYPQKCAQYAHYIILRTRHRWLKSKQSFQSQNTPKRCISHSNTHCLVKNRATSQFARSFQHFQALCSQSEKTHCQAPAPTCLFPSILLKILFTTVKTNIWKHRIVNSQFSNRKKRRNLRLHWQFGKTTLRHFADTFFVRALSKIRNLLISQL